MLHHWIQVWFGWVEQWGYLGIVILMAMESSIIPVPSEVVMAPAGFWAAQGKFSFAGVVLAGTVGSYLGSILSYWVALLAGRPALKKYGKYFLLKAEKIEFAEQWVKNYGAPGVFVARFLPVVRHLISIPAGAFRMDLLKFSVSTTVGAGLWCGVLAWFGQKVIGDHPELLASPAAMVHVMKEKLHWIVLAVLVLGGLYAVVINYQKKSKPHDQPLKAS